MRKRFKTVILFVFFIPFFGGCEQFLEVELPGQEPRLVMNALLEPTDTIKVYLTKSKGILEGADHDEFEYVKDGQVYLKTEDGSLKPFDFIDKSETYRPFAFYYLAGHDFNVNEYYEILAESPGFKEIIAKAQLPEKVAIKELTYRNLGPYESFSTHDLLEFTMKFDDPPGGVNFYELTGSFYGQSITDENSFYSGDLRPWPVNPVYERESWARTGILFNDLLLPGNDSELVFRAILPKGYNLDVTINLSHISESSYRYEETVSLQGYNRGDFLSQPVLVYTNVQNGLGILKARNKEQKVLKILLEE